MKKLFTAIRQGKIEEVKTDITNEFTFIKDWGFYDYINSKIHIFSPSTYLLYHFCFVPFCFYLTNTTKYH